MKAYVTHQECPISGQAKCQTVVTAGQQVEVLKMQMDYSNNHKNHKNNHKNHTV